MEGSLGKVETKEKEHTTRSFSITKKQEEELSNFDSKYNLSALVREKIDELISEIKTIEAGGES